MRYRADATWLRTGEGRRIVLGGSPLRLFRLTDAGGRVADRIEQGEALEHSTLIDRLVDAGALHPAPDPRDCTWTHAEVTIVTPQLGGTAADDGRITVDDGSTPVITGATTRLAANRGPAAARNAGRRLVDTELIAFVDADVHLAARDDGESSWLDELLPHFDDPRVGLVAPRVRGGARTSLDMGDAPARIRAGTRVGYVPAAAIVVRAAAFDDIGGFDEGLRFGEDVDFVWRLDAAGWSSRYEPGSSVWHEPRSTWAERLRQQVGYGSAAAALALRHPRELAPFRSNVWNASAWVLGALIHPVLGLGLAACGAATAVRRLPGVPPALTLRVAVGGQMASGQQLATALRRVWWPVIGVLAVGSRRARSVAIAAALANPAAVPTDVAYGWGVWRGMWERRTLKPIVPSLTGGFSASGPARSRRPEQSRGPGVSPAADAR